MAREPAGADAAIAEAIGLPGVQARRLWAGSYVDFYASSISPDGRYLSMVDWSTTDLGIRDLQTGELHKVTNAVRAEGKPYEDAGVSVFSRAGDRVVVGWQYYPLLQLRVLDLEFGPPGPTVVGEPNVILHNPELEPYYPFDWSPDDREVLAKVYTSGNANQLALISMDGTYRALKSFDWREPTMAEFSPDGRYIAYDFPPDPDGVNRDVFVVSRDGTEETVIVRWSGVDRLLGWHPDGSILFHSDRGGRPAIWRVPVDAGRPVGEPELVMADTRGVEPLGFAGDHFYYGVDVNPRRLYTAGVDLAAGELTTTPTPVADPAVIDVVGWTWSPDGEFFAYSGTAPGTMGSRMVIRAADGREVQSLALPLRASSRLHWHPARRAIVLFGRDDKSRWGFYEVDLGTGAYRTIFYRDLSEIWTPRGNFTLSPDGATLYFAIGTAAQLTAGSLDLVAYDIDSGAVRRIAEISSYGLGTLSMSPDGAQLAVVGPAESPDEGVIATVSVDGGPLRPLATIPQGHLVFRLEWVPNGESIVYTLVEPEESIRTAHVVDTAAPGESRILSLGEGASRLLRFHPNGRQIAFTSGESRGEVWVLDGLGADTDAGPGDDRW
ncbi:MAG: hypothetical protein R3195_05240 [Gemmatimonadota bacterium]|nr:hypothetical protein [Gemmatimonadota bacterium]